MEYSGKINVFSHSRDFFKWMSIMIVSQFFGIMASLLLIPMMNYMIALKLKQSIIVLFLNFLCWTLCLFFGWIKERIQNQLTLKTIQQLRCHITNVINSYSDEKYFQNDTGVYVSWFTNDINQINEGYLQNTFVLYENIVVGLLSFLTILYINFWLAGTSAIMLILVSIFPRFFEKSIQDKLIVFSKGQEYFTQKIKNILGGFQIWSNFQCEDQFYKRMNKESKEVEVKRQEYMNTVSFSYALINWVNIIAQVINNLLCIVLIGMQKISPGTILSVGNLTGKFYNSLTSISTLKTKMKSTESLLYKYQIMKQEIKEKKLVTFNDSIRLEGISYSYNGASKVINDLNLEFKKNGKYALIGNSGTGKSTILKILARELTNYDGAYYIDGVNVKSIDTTSIKEHIAYITQDSYIFDTTIHDNLTLGRDIDKIKLKEVIEKCLLSDFISDIKDLYKPILENGKNLSGGQKQRIALARAILANKDIYLIDEVTSGVDFQTMLSIEDYLLKNSNITLIYISHHLSKDMMGRFDKIIDLSA